VTLEPLDLAAQQVRVLLHLGLRRQLRQQRRLGARCQADTGRSPAEYAAPFDTVYVSLWKYFNSGVGAILAGPRRVLDGMFHTRRMFGGNLAVG
jgi:hypothetical protein